MTEKTLEFAGLRAGNSLPLMLFGEVGVSLMPIFVLLVAPLVSGIAQLALSRVREFQADLGSAELLGDPRPLVAALTKMDRMGVGFLERWVQAGRREASPLLRTHPTTDERIQRLQGLLHQSDTHHPVENRLPPSVLPWSFPLRDYRLTHWSKDRYLL